MSYCHLSYGDQCLEQEKGLVIAKSQFSNRENSNSYRSMKVFHFTERTIFYFIRIIFKNSSFSTSYEKLDHAKLIPKDFEFTSDFKNFQFGRVIFFYKIDQKSAEIQSF